MWRGVAVLRHAPSCEGLKNGEMVGTVLWRLAPVEAVVLLQVGVDRHARLREVCSAVAPICFRSHASAPGAHRRRGNSKLACPPERSQP
jgi:hypothetical protein